MNRRDPLILGNEDARYALIAMGVFIDKYPWVCGVVVEPFLLVGLIIFLLFARSKE